MAQEVTIDQVRARKTDDYVSSLGSGFLWPPRIDSDGTVSIVEGLDHITSCVKRIVSYNKGDMVALWRFGGGLSGRVFGVLSSNSMEQVRDEVRTALTEFEPRISDIRVFVGKDNQEENSMAVITQYKVVSTGEINNAVFPIPKE